MSIQEIINFSRNMSASQKKQKSQLTCGLTDSSWDLSANFVNAADLRNIVIQKCFENGNCSHNTHQIDYFGTERWRCRKVQSLNSAIYNIKVTPDSKTMLVGTQEAMILYNCEIGLSHIQTLHPARIRWTMTDTDISDDSTMGLSCSLNPYVTLYDLFNSKVLAELNLNDSGDDQDDDDWYGLKFYSMKISHDKASLLGGSGTLQTAQSFRSYIKYFDVVKNKIVHSIPAHQNDINSIGFVQRNLSSVFVSGSDDSFVKVWDTRTLGFSKKPVGKLYGHFCGITNVSSRNDGIYICSNGKDQHLKLWDLRKMSNEENLAHKPMLYDYRSGRISQKIQLDFENYIKNNQHTDQSAASYLSHNIERTLIRCHFSPLETTNSEYIITGSSCGRIFIYSIYDPSQKPIILSSRTGQINKKPHLDNEDQYIQQKIVEQVEYLGDEEDDQIEAIIRDLAWTNTGIITGNFQGIIQEFKQY